MENDNMVGVWVKTLGPFMYGRVDAVDAGWTHDDRLIWCRVQLGDQGSDTNHIASLTFRRRRYAVYWRRL